jgi:hypothetical protein
VGGNLVRRLNHNKEGTSLRGCKTKAVDSPAREDPAVGNPEWEDPAVDSPEWGNPVADSPEWGNPEWEDPVQRNPVQYSPAQHREDQQVDLPAVRHSPVLAVHNWNEMSQGFANGIPAGRDSLMSTPFLRIVGHWRTTLPHS